MRRVRLVLVILFLGILGLLLVRSRMGVDVPQGSALVLELSGSYVDAPEHPLARFFGRRARPLVGLLSELAKAERDSRLATVVLRVGSLETGWAKAQEIRAALGRLREKGRRVVAHLEVEGYGANLEYFVASAAEQIYLAPGNRSPFAGLAAEYMFLGGFFEKLGVEVEYERVGRYKSAVETLAERSMSPDNREMANALLDSIESQFVTSIAESRNLSSAAVRSVIDATPVTAREMVDAGLADDVRYYEAVIEGLGDPPLVEADDYARVDAASLGFQPAATLALVYGSGPVVVGEGTVNRSGAPVLASRTVSEALIEAGEDPEIDGIVFRIDSPGGSALASDLVWDATRRVKAMGKPVIASFSDVAASGGYYVAAGADAIVANPATLTGSIGAFVLRPVLGDLFDKLDIGVEGLTRGKHADLFLSSRPLSPGTRARLRADIEATYELFVSRVSEGRGLEPEAVDEAGQGRVWTGEQALQQDLVDALGGLRVAALEARRALGLDPDADVALIPYPPPKPLAAQLGELLGGAWALRGLTGMPLPSAARTLLEVVTSLPPGSPALLPPVLVEIR